MRGTATPAPPPRLKRPSKQGQAAPGGLTPAKPAFAGWEKTSSSAKSKTPFTARLRRILRRPSTPRQIDVVEGYGRWAATYEQDMDGHPLALAESGAMLGLLPECAGVTALDAACGTGRYARLLAERGAQVIGVDQSAEMLERARAALTSNPTPAGWKTGGTPHPRGLPARATLYGGTASARFIQGDLLALPLEDASCDLAVVALALAHLETEQLKQAFAELRRVLRSGGALLMSEMHPFGALTGGRCRFEQGAGTGRQIYHIQTHTHLHEDYFAAADAAGFALEALREPRLMPDLFPAFERAGMGMFARQFAGFPLALVCRWRVAEQRGSSK